MDNIKNRIKKLRKILELNQTEFGQKLGLSQKAIANIETGASSLTERNFNAICKTFSVNPEWLRYGVGEIFIEMREKIIQSVAEEFELDEMETNLVKTFLELPAKYRQGVLEWAKKFAITLAIELKLERTEIKRYKSDNEKSIDEMLKETLEELSDVDSARKRGTGTSSVFTTTNGSCSKKIKNSRL